MNKIFKYPIVITLFYFNQLVSILLSIVYNFILFYFLKKYKYLKIFIVPTDTFGPTLQRLINYQEFIKKEKLKKKNILFVLNKVKYTNTEIYPVISNNFNAIENNLLFNFFLKCSLLNKKKIFNTSNIKNHNASFEYNILVNKLRFDKNQIQKKKTILKKIGIKKNFVCVSNRDNFFHNNKNFNNYRNSKFEKLNLAIKYLKKKIIKSSEWVPTKTRKKKTTYQFKNYLRMKEI